jgi:putative serine protease PepD
MYRFDSRVGNPTSIATIGGGGQSASPPVTSSTAENPDWQAVIAAVDASVVSIQVQNSQGEAEGSGMVLDSEGHVLTNNHVVAGAQDNKVIVTLSDGRIFEADVVGTDQTTDLAVVKLVDAPSDLKAVSMGDSNSVQVGDPVMAVGNPLGLANTATTGIVSALDRPVVATGETSDTPVVTNAIQIDAAVNPGNSGGPLFDAQGLVIGVTSSIASLSSPSATGQSGSIGLGFAIPIDLARNISGQLIDTGHAEHAFLGVTMVSGTATADGVTRRGARIESVQDGSPAAEAGLRVGDVVVAINNVPVNGSESLTAFVREMRAGQRVTLTVVRESQASQVGVTLAVRDDSANPSGGSGQGTPSPTPTPSLEQGSDQQNNSEGSLWDRLFGGSGN